MYNPVIVVVGLGYVGLPLATEFGKKYRTIGFDVSERRIEDCSNHRDPSGEVSADELKASAHLSFSTSASAIAEADFVIVAVPTPVDDANIPDFSPLIAASTTVGKHLKKGATVVYESTVYPGATEDVCIPLLETCSGMKWKEGFNVGYSPERVNPGDKVRTLTKIVKVVSGDDAATLDSVATLYESIIEAGVCRASSIKVAEASKVIENTQRDLNIALMNELAIVFDKIGIDTIEVLEAAGTKWNFLPFRPGLVGGHCIGVDPYYLTYKAQILDYLPQVILAGRRINDGMPSYLAKKIVQLMVNQGSCSKGDAVIVLGLAFKENCPDIRNSKSADLVRHLESFGLKVYVHDPLVDPEDALHEHGIQLSEWDSLPRGVNAVIAAVPHQQYSEMPLDDILSLLNAGGVFADIKSAYDASAIKDAGYTLWRL